MKKLINQRIFIFTTSEKFNKLTAQDILEFYRLVNVHHIVNSYINDDSKIFSKLYNCKLELVNNKTIFKIKTEDFLNKAIEDKKKIIENLKYLINKDNVDLKLISETAYNNDHIKCFLKR